MIPSVPECNHGPHHPWAMSRPPPPLPPAPPAATPPAADDICAYLRANPAFLATHPALYETLDPPNRIHGAPFADHMAAMLANARNRAATAEHLAARAATEAATSRRNAEAFARRVQETVVALMRAPDPAWLATHELAALLHVDAARLCAETSTPSNPTPPHPTPIQGAAPIPRGTVAATLGQRPALVRQVGASAAQPDARLHGETVHGEAVALATEEALVRIPLRTGPALLALASRDPGGLLGANTETLAFLGQAVAAALERS